MRSDDQAPDGTPLQQEITIEATEPAHEWTLKKLTNTEHGFHGIENCPTCLGRYVTLTTAFDAGFKFGTDQLNDFAKAGTGIYLPPGKGLTSS